MAEMEYRYTLHGEKRQDVGKGASRRLRKENKVPAIIYGGKEEPLSVVLLQNELTKNARFDSFYSQIINLIIDGEGQEVLLRDMQRHPYKPIIQHVDLQRIVRGQELNATVVLHFLNEDACPAVKNEGGIITHEITEVEIVCRPRYLPERIEVDMANVRVGDVIYLSDLVMPEGVRLQQEDELEETVVANVFIPRVSLEEEEETPAVAETSAADSDKDKE